MTPSDPKATIMSKIAAEKRRRTYSIDDHTYAAENGHGHVTEVSEGAAGIPEVVSKLALLII